MVSSGTIKALPASVRQPLGFRTTYNSMHGEQIELSQAYAGALPGTPTATASALGTATALATVTAVGIASRSAGSSVNLGSMNGSMNGTAPGCRPASAEAGVSVMPNKASTPQVTHICQIHTYQTHAKFDYC